MNNTNNTDYNPLYSAIGGLCGPLYTDLSILTTCSLYICIMFVIYRDMLAAPCFMVTMQANIPAMLRNCILKMELNKASHPDISLRK
jgi:hypothetical protein